MHSYPKLFHLKKLSHLKKIAALGMSIVLTASLLITTGCTSRSVAAGEQKEITGMVEAKEVNINSKIPGRIQKLLVTEGQQVKAGDLLAIIDDQELKAQEEQAQANLTAAKAALTKAKAARDYADASTGAALSKAEAALAKAEADAELARKSYERMAILYEERAISAQQLDNSERDLKAALAALEAARSEVASAKAARLQVDVNESEIQAAEAALARAEAALHQIQINLRETRITAPCAGTVTAVNVEEGELVTTGTTILTITDFANNWVNVKVTQPLLEQLHEGQVVTLQPVAMPHKKLCGKIITINRKPEFAVQRATNKRGEKDIVAYNVKIQINNPELRPGMTVVVDFNNSSVLEGGTQP